MPELSIIVPVYKVEKHLKYCIESILDQSFKNFELILIDDGSPDRCGEICDEYAKIDARIIVLHQKNQGVSVARNMGLDIATGNYIGFVDADDYIDSKMYETMIRVAKVKQVDVVACGANHCEETHEFLFTELLAEGKYDREEMLAALYSMPNPLGGCVWNKIVKREKLKHIRYKDGVSMAEDRLFLFDYFCNCDTCYKIGTPLYWVVERMESASHELSVEKRCVLLKSSRLLLEKAAKHSFDLECKAIEKYLDDCSRNIRQIKKIGKETGQLYKKEWTYFQISMLKIVSMGLCQKKITPQKAHRFFNEWIENFII